MGRRQRSKKERSSFGRRKECRNANRRRRGKESERSELLGILGWDSRRELLVSLGSAPEENQDHRMLEGERDDQQARWLGVKTLESSKMWLRRQKDDKENGWEGGDVGETKRVVRGG